MKATGIVRRIDDLGRVVIPKNIRKDMKIQEGDPLEIYIDDGCVVFKKYLQEAPETRILQASREIFEAINEIYDNKELDLNGKLLKNFAEYIQENYGKAD